MVDNVEIHQLGDFKKNEPVVATMENDGKKYRIDGKYTGERSVKVVRDISLPDDHRELCDEFEEALNKIVKTKKLESLF